MNVTFLLPVDNRSGGVRVTAIMAERLRQNGHTVRIILTAKRTFTEKLKGLSRAIKRDTHDGWLYLFQGKLESATDLNTRKFHRGEVVIAVGSYTIDKLAQLKADVIKLRYNHGLPAKFDDDAERVWSYAIPTITVSNTLVPTLEKHAPGMCMGVVPNGIDMDQYYQMGMARDGIGVFFGSHPNKAPDFIVAVMKALYQRFPQVPFYLISGDSCPSELKFVNYFQYPSVEKVCEIYNKCRVWLLPSDTEGLPGPVLEAMSCGTLVVSTDNAGSLEIIEPEVNGLISPRRDLEAFVANVERALTDDALWQKVVKNGARRAKEFSWEAAVEKMENVLSRLAQ